MLLIGKRIFIVEDNSGNLALATVYLKQHGAIVLFAQGAADAMKRIVKVGPIDIILMDLVLSDTTGFAVFQDIKAIAGFEDVPVVAVSASDPDIAMLRARELGFSGYIAKPITPKISSYIADILEGKPVWIGDTRY